VEKAKLKQTWTVMSRAETVYAKLFVEAELEDGSRVVLMSPPPDGGFWRRLWAPSDARTVNYLPSLLVYPRYADAFCRYYWRLTDRQVFPAPRRAIVLMYEWREIPPPGVGVNWPLKQGRTEVYRVSAEGR
jgi:hypothetical protein